MEKVEDIIVEKNKKQHKLSYNSYIKEAGPISSLILISLYLFRNVFADGMQFDEVFRISQIFDILLPEAESFKQSIFDINILGVDIPVMLKQYISTGSLILFIPIVVFSTLDEVIVLRCLYYIYYIVPILIFYFVSKKKSNKKFAFTSSFFILISPLLFPGIRIWFGNVLYLIPISLLLYLYDIKKSKKQFFILGFSFAFMANISFYFVWNLLAICIALIVLYPKEMIELFKKPINNVILISGCLLGLFNFVIYNVMEGFPTISILFNSIFNRTEYNENPIDFKTMSTFIEDIANKCENYISYLGKGAVPLIIIQVLSILICLFFLFFKYRELSEKKLKIYLMPVLIYILTLLFIMISPNATGMHHYAYLAVWQALSCTSAAVLLINLMKNIKYIKILIKTLIIGYGLSASVSTFICVNEQVITGGTGYYSPAIYDLVEYCQENEIKGNETIHFNWGIYAQMYFLNRGDYKIVEHAYSLMNLDKSEVYENLDEYFEGNLMFEFYFPAYDSETTEFVLEYFQDREGQVLLEQTFYERDGEPVIYLYKITRVYFASEEYELVDSS